MTLRFIVATLLAAMASVSAPAAAADERADSVTAAAATVMAEFVKPGIERLKELGLPIDDDKFLADFARIYLGESAVFASAEAADAYISGFFRQPGALPPAELPDTMTVESQTRFMAEAAARSGARLMPSGLVFETVTEGTGDHPLDGQTVLVSYVGRLSDGGVFDETESPIELPVSKLVAGFTEGLKMMQPGGSYRLYIPADLAYGRRGVPGAIPGNAALLFEVTLVKIL